MYKLLLLSGLILFCEVLQATTGANYVVGEVYDITSTVEGLLVRVKDAQATNIVPTECQNPGPYGWMVIPESSKAMVSVALTMCVQNKRNAAIYVSPTTSGACQIIQYDPKD